MPRHLSQPGLERAPAGGLTQPLGDLGADGVDPVSQHLAQGLELLSGLLTGLALHRPQALIETGERDPEIVQRLGRAGLGGGQPLAQPLQHRRDHSLRLGAGHSAFKRAQGFIRAGSTLTLQAAQAVAEVAGLRGGLGERAFQAHDRGVLRALGGLDAGQGVADRMFDAVDGQARAGLRGLDTVGDTIERLGDPGKVRDGPIREGRRGRRVLGEIVFQDHMIEPCAERHARTTGVVFRDLAGLRVNTLDAPGRPRAHPNRISRATADATHRFLGCKRGDDTTSGGIRAFLWMADRSSSRPRR